jgi:hypothetical protein
VFLALAVGVGPEPFHLVIVVNARSAGPAEVTDSSIGWLTKCRTWLIVWAKTVLKVSDRRE